MQFWIMEGYYMSINFKRLTKSKISKNVQLIIPIPKKRNWEFVRDQ